MPSLREMLATRQCVTAGDIVNNELFIGDDDDTEKLAWCVGITGQRELAYYVYRDDPPRVIIETPHGFEYEWTQGGVDVARTLADAEKALAGMCEWD